MTTMYCPYCDNEVQIVIKPSGPHLKAECGECGKYLKFMNKEEKKLFEKEEDEKGGYHEG